MKVVIILIITSALLYFNSKNPITPEWKIKRNIRYSFIIKNDSKDAIKDVVFQTYSPLPLNSTQKLVNLQSDYEFIKENDIFGNQILSFPIALIPPYGKKNISITAQLVLSKKVAGAKRENKLFLSHQPLIESNSEKLKKFALTFKGSNREKLKQIYNWEVETINYSGYGSKDKGALYALKNLEGDCTEFAYLMVAISRALGMPARAVNGYIVDHDSKLNTSEFHTWAEVWIDDAWRMIDAQKQVFMENQENYLAMNIVTETSKNKTKFKRFRLSDPNLTIRMK